MLRARIPAVRVNSTISFTVSNMINDSTDIKREIRAKYGRIVQDGGGCCAGGECSPGVSSMMVDSYDTLAGHEPEADLSLGCGVPTRFAAFAPGETVVDLGSGAGNDAFVARHAVGNDGEVLGLDMTEAMVERAGEIALRKGYRNVRFKLGDIEDMPLSDRSVRRLCRRGARAGGVSWPASSGRLRGRAFPQ